MPKPRLLATLATTACLAACASADPSTASGDWIERLRADGWKTGATVTSIPNFRLDGFKTLDASHVVLYSGVNRRHLVSFGSACSGLVFAQRLAYRTTGGSLGRFDTLTVVEPGPAINVPCVIDSIQALERTSG